MGMDPQTRMILLTYIIVVAITFFFFVVPVFASDGKDCILDNNGPCYEDSDCCSGDCPEHSPFFCRPNGFKEDDCVPVNTGPCYSDSDCCKPYHCFHDAGIYIEWN